MDPCLAQGVVDRIGSFAGPRTGTMDQMDIQNLPMSLTLKLRVGKHRSAAGKGLAKGC